MATPAQSTPIAQAEVQNASTSFAANYDKGDNSPHSTTRQRWSRANMATSPPAGVALLFLFRLRQAAVVDDLSRKKGTG